MIVSLCACLFVSVIVVFFMAAVYTAFVHVDARFPWPQQSFSSYIYISTYVCICVYVYIYTLYTNVADCQYTLGASMATQKCVCACVCMHVYVYICVYSVYIYVVL